ncbi:MAG: hypothetical protein E6Q63_04990 [Novosphingobium sp.]|nr:MAG: hypothetical protein E6Q63_04990 [Novosphingobium sp.]
MGTSARTPRWQPGLALDCAHAELFAPARDACGAGMALALARDALRQQQVAELPDSRTFLWVQDKATLRLSGRPYLPGLPADLRHRLIHFASATPEDALFALEEGLRCRDMAFVMGEIGGNPRALDFTASRRLSLAAEKHGVPLWLVRLDARRDLGAARMRWEVGPAPSPRPRWNAHAPGTATWRADLFRAHTFHPGQWTLRDDDALLVAEPALPESRTPDHGDLVHGSGDRSLATG